MTSGIGLSIISTTGLTTGSLIRATSSTAGAISSNGAVSIRATGAFTSTTVGYVDILATAAAAGTVLSVANSAAQTSGIIFQVLQTGTTTGFTGKVASITGSHTTGGTTLLVTDVTTTTGDAVKIVSNALVAGTSTALNVAHTTSVLGAGNSLVRISSTGVDVGTTTGTLLDLAQTAAAGNVAALITDSSADVAARSILKLNITNAAAVLAIPLEVQNAAVVGANSKFKLMGKFGSVSLYVGIDAGGNDPNAQLTGVAGDVCFNGASNKPYYCTAAPTTWATVV
jgi:hypothetical protein